MFATWLMPAARALLLILGFFIHQLNEALEDTSEHPHSAAVPRQTMDYNEPRGPGDETWAET